MPVYCIQKIIFVVLNVEVHVEIWAWKLEKPRLDAWKVFLAPAKDKHLWKSSLNHSREKIQEGKGDFWKLSHSFSVLLIYLSKKLPQHFD